MQSLGRVLTLAEVILPRPGFLRHVLLIATFSLLNGLAAQVAVPLPFSPVPITAQTFAVLLTGLLLGSRFGALALVTYLAEGLIGLPFFAGGSAGPAVLAGPRGGYLLGFVMAAYIVGALAERGWDRRVWTTALAMVVGNLTIYAIGTAWLARFVGPDQAVALGVVPFIPGDILKIALAAVALPGGWRLIGRLPGR